MWKLIALVALIIALILAYLLSGGDPAESSEEFEDGD